MALHEVAFFFELRQSLIARQKLTRIRQILLHLLLDLFQVFGSERGRPVKIVKKSALGRRAVAQLGLGKKLQHRRRQQVRRRMPVHLERLGIFIVQEAKIGIFFEGTSKVDEIAVGFGHQSRIRQSRTDGLRNLQRRRALGNIFNASIRKLHMNAICHRVGTCRGNEYSSLWEGRTRVKQAIVLDGAPTHEPPRYTKLDSRGFSFVHLSVPYQLIQTFLRTHSRP